MASEHQPGDLITHDLERTAAAREPVVAAPRKGGNMLVDPATTTNEHYTPKWLSDAARAVMAKIDLDPASCEAANRVIGADVWYGKGSPHGEDGFDAAYGSKGWNGNVFLNPPGGYISTAHVSLKPRVSAVPVWWRTLVQQWQRGNVHQAIFLAFNMNVFRTAQAYADVAPPFCFPFCVPRDRICFDRLNEQGERVPGRQPPQDSAIIYLPPSGNIDNENDNTHERAVRRFRSVFSTFGVVRV